ncbi:MAG: GNAT family N-acetyltransferase [Pseudomonadota bacterium]|nr:GNAT family N-acetyltransferase [Pseudomonadota bacterium]
MGDGITLRRAGPADHDVLGAVMYDAVHNGPGRYSEAQRRAWMPGPRRGPDWDARLAGQIIMLAEHEGEIAGFMSLAPPDYVDFAYIRPAWQGRGLFRQLYNKIEDMARASGQTRLTVHASLMAQPAFTAVGFAIVTPETVEVRGETLDRFAMEKRLDG